LGGKLAGWLYLGDISGKIGRISGKPKGESSKTKLKTGTGSQQPYVALPLPPTKFFEKPFNKNQRIYLVGGSN